jgi:pantoate--beta-alanine ligase
VLHDVLEDLAEQLAQKIAADSFDESVLQSLLTKAAQRITQAGFEIDYLQVKTTDLQAIDFEAFKLKENQQDLIILVAATLGQARLLDNQLVLLNRPLVK